MTSTMTSTDLDNDRCPRCGERLASEPATLGMLALLKEIDATWPVATSELRERTRKVIAEAEPANDGQTHE